jgi:hypothetical protein
MDYLLFTSNYDGALTDHVNEWVTQAGPALDEIWGRCEGYPSGRETNPDKFKREFVAYLQRHSYQPGAFYLGYRGESVKAVRGYNTVMARVQEFVDLPDVERYAANKLQALIDILPEAVKRSQPLKPVTNFLRSMSKLLLFVLDLLWHLLIVFIFRPLQNLVLRRDPPLNLNLSEELQEGILDIEDVVTQNQLTVISRIKPGIWTGIKLRVVLTGIHLVGKYYQNQGSLGGIATIHFARWVIIDRGRWLLFTSNYDGSWESYIGDFVDKAAAGMDAIWRSAPNYPKQGSIDIEAFKAIIRANQVRTQTFYSAYPHETIINILNNRTVARALEKQRVTDWLGRL